jgi:hypothetical protein
MKLSRIKKAALDKVESLLWYIARGDDGLTEELNRIGPKGVIAIAVVISVSCSLALTLWVIL